MKRICRQVLRCRWSFAFSTLAGIVLWPFPSPGQGDSAWETFPQGQFRPAQVQATGRVGFTVLGPGQTGVQFTNVLSDETAASNQILLNGSGVALGDVDGDGRTDVYLCALEGPNQLFRNLGGWRFMNTTATAGVACDGDFSTGAALADLDGDRDLDLLVNAVARGTRLFLNDGQGRFQERTDSGLLRRFGATSLALADVDGDGDLDLYVANYRSTTIRTTGLALLNVNGRKAVRPEDRNDLEITPEGKVLEHGEPDAFYLNDGQGRFQRINWLGGLFRDEDGQPLKTTPRDWGLSVMFRDINQDGFPDLYVCNDFHSPDRLWLNNGLSGFQAAPRLALRHTSTFSMSVDFADIDRDGRDDFFLADMLDLRRERRMAQFSAIEPSPSAIGVFDDRPQYDRNTLHWNRGDGTFAEIACFAGLEAAAWTWCAGFLDVDLDGLEDLLLTTGHLFDTQDLDAADRIHALGPMKREMIPRKLLMFPRLAMPKFAFRNNGHLRFSQVGERWGFHDEGVAHGMAFGDLDNDGDLDVVVNNLNRAAGLYRNECDKPRVAVRLRGQPPNTRAIGSRVSLIAPSLTQSQEIIAGGRYLSSDDAMRTFAWPGGADGLRLEIQWRTGGWTVVSNIAPNRIYEIDELREKKERPAVPPAASPLFEDLSARLGHRHVEFSVDDFARQPLLPRRLSQAGPGVAWADWDGDGWDDLIIGSGAGGQTALFKNDRRGGLARWDHALFQRPNERDQLGLAEAAVGLAAATLLVTQPGDASEPDGTTSLKWFDFRASKAGEIAHPGASSLGPLALADIDGDGDLDLFAGGRAVPGRYPEAAPSFLLRRETEGWIPDAKNAEALKRVGLVNGAVFSDLDQDGFPELILACEWGPVRVFRNQRGLLSENTSELGLASHTGWWNGVATCDLDADGQPDIVASNWGLNSKYRASRAAPQRIYFGDFDDDGTLDLLEAHRDPFLAKEVPERDLAALRRAMPGLMARFSTHAAFATASVGEVLGEKLAQTRFVEANTLASMVFMNRSARFEAWPLSDEAQFSPAFAVVPADFDGDGREDIFLSQNFFATEPATPRNDAGRGLLLRGDGKGGLVPVSSQESGLAVYGEQRGAAAGDFDGDGRVDLVVTQNGADTKLYRNVRATPGLRVRLAGPPENPRGIGASVRVKSAQGWGCLREVQSGSSYLSQNSSVLVFADARGIDEIEVLWPGGKKMSAKIPVGAKTIVLRTDGTLEARND